MLMTVTDLPSYQQFALEQQAQNNAFSAEQVQRQMDFQERMSNTAHQREVFDLQAAGLNPILSVNSGASVPVGNSASPDTSTAGNVGNILQQVLQAQSAREVAAMYNAATINAASIAAQASMYGADMSYANSEDHPNSLAAVAARQLNFVGHQLDSSPLVQGIKKAIINVASKDPEEVSKNVVSAVKSFSSSSSSGSQSTSTFLDSAKRYFGVDLSNINGIQKNIINAFWNRSGLSFSTKLKFLKTFLLKYGFKIRDNGSSGKF